MVQVFLCQHIDKIVYLNQLFSFILSHKAIFLFKKERKVTANFIFSLSLKMYNVLCFTAYDMIKIAFEIGLTDVTIDSI